MTPYGNPAFQLFLMATLAAHGLCWPTGEEKMLLVSVGTGSYNQARPKINRGGESLLYYACAVPSIMIGANVTCQDLLCRVFGLCKVGDPIDAEVGDMIAEPRGPVAPKLFTYLRYDADLSDDGLEQIGIAGVRASDVQKLDSCAHIAELQAIGRATARKVEERHCAGFVP